jgi:hypothetical protein
MTKSTRPFDAKSFDRANLRFLWYRRAIGISKLHVARTWRRSPEDLFELIRAGARAINGSSRPAPIRHRPPEETVEGVVKALARADDWTRRLSAFLHELGTADARTAVTRLVRLGCVPDQLVWCVEELRRPSALAIKRQQDSDHRTAVRALAKQFETLAKACDDYILDSYRWSYVINQAIGPRQSQDLRQQSDRIRAFADAIEIRPRRQFDPSHTALLIVSGEIRRITGTFREDLLAPIVQTVPRFSDMTPEALRKWRARYSALAT